MLPSPTQADDGMTAGRTLAAAVAAAETLRVRREAEGEAGSDGDGETGREELVEA